MKSILITSIILFSVNLALNAQKLDVEGSIKVTNMVLNNTADSVVVRLTDGTLAIREASTLTGLQGPQGLPGNDGADGPAGPQGNPGISGVSTAGFGIEITGDGSVGMPYVIALSGHYLGEIFEGGIIYSLSEDKTSGLIASLRNLSDSAGVEWGFYGTLVANSESISLGDSNTVAIINAGGALSEAAGICDTFTGGGFTDWYLPSVLELKQMDAAILTIRNVLENDGDSTTVPLDVEYSLPALGGYWTSTSDGMYRAWTYFFPRGQTDLKAKNSTYRIRAIRSF